MWQLISGKEKVIDLCESDRNLPYKIVVEKCIVREFLTKVQCKIR